MVSTLSLQLKCHSAASNVAYCFVASSSTTCSYARPRQQCLQVWVCVSGSGCMGPVFDTQHHQAVLCIQDQCSTAPVVSTTASREQENIVGKPYAQSLSRTQNMSPQRVPTERFQVPAQHYQTLVTVNHSLEKKRKEKGKTAPFGVSLIRSLDLYWAAQEPQFFFQCRHTCSLLLSHAVLL